MLQLQQMAKDKLAQELEQAKAETDAAATLAAMPFTCAACESVSDTPLDGCNGCQDSPQRPFYCNKRCQEGQPAGAPQGLREQNSNAVRGE